MSTEHYSDCAVNNGPAYEPGPCDCGGYDPDKRIAELEAFALRVADTNILSDAQGVGSLIALREDARKILKR